MKRHSGIRLALLPLVTVLCTCTGARDEPRRATEPPRLAGPGGCPPDRGDCDGDSKNGCEVDLETDSAHCGSCGKNCFGPNVESALCVASGCKIDRCLGEAGDCDAVAENGCEGRICQSSHGPDCRARCKDDRYGYEF